MKERRGTSAIEEQQGNRTQRVKAKRETAAADEKQRGAKSGAQPSSNYGHAGCSTMVLELTLYIGFIDLVAPDSLIGRYRHADFQRDRRRRVSRKAYEETDPQTNSKTIWETDTQVDRHETRRQTVGYTDSQTTVGEACKQTDRHAFRQTVFLVARRTAEVTATP